MKPNPFNHVYLGDCIEGMKTLPAESVDLVITDPPFGIHFDAHKENYHRTPTRVLTGYAEINPQDYLTFTHNWMTQVKRLLKPNASMFVFSGWNNLKDILIALDTLEFITINHLIWKYQFGVHTTRKFITSHYHCLYVCLNDKQRTFFPNARFHKDEKTPTGRSLAYHDREDVWDIPREYWTGDIKTPTKLPAALIRKLLAYTSHEGDLICDPFMGSGQVAVVSHMERRRYVGFEIVKEYHDFITERLTTGHYRIKDPTSPQGTMPLEEE